MDPTVSALILMVFGFFLIGGAYSFRKQKLPLVASIILALAGVGFLGYGGYVLFTY